MSAFKHTFLLITALLVGCGDDDSNSPASPDPTSSLLGIDADNNGVRDDIQQYIDQKYSHSTKIRLALYSKAKNLREVLTAPADDLPNALILAEKTFRTTDCLTFIMGDSGLDASADIRTRYLNTSPRQKAFAIFDRQLAGQMFSSFDETSQACDFDVNAAPN